nr:uncharacterized protein LOC111509773 isoform X2 [Leptinotarsa decemlineata]
MTPTKKINPSERNLFQLCFPCFSKSSVDCDEIMLRSFGREFTEYEYVIENLAIRRAPKVLLDSYQPPPKIKSRYGQTKKPTVKHLAAGSSVKKPSPEVMVGPVVETEDATPEDSHLLPPIESREKPVCGPCTPNMAGYNPCQTKGFHNVPCRPCRPRTDDKMNQNETVLKKALVPPIYRRGPPKLQVSADIHKDGEVEKSSKAEKKSIPTEIQETIDALRSARPTHLAPLPRKNQRNLMRSVSDTSCDKETFCNFLGLENFKEETSEETRSSRMNIYFMENKRKPSSRSPQFRKRSVSPRKTETNDITGRGENAEEIDKHKLEQMEIEKEKLKSQSLKWKIIINKHKDKIKKKDVSPNTVS